MCDRSIPLGQLRHNRADDDLGLHTNRHTVVIGGEPDPNIAFVQKIPWNGMITTTRAVSRFPQIPSTVSSPSTRTSIL